LTPITLDDFFTACRHYFRNKRIEADDQVSAILGGFEDQRVKNWLRPKAENERVLTLTFDEFIAEVRTRFLPDDWEMKERLAIQHAKMKPDESFLDFATTVESHAALLLDTDSEYDNTRLRHALEAGMHSTLARLYEQPRNVHIRNLNPDVQYDQWKKDVEKIDVDRRSSGKNLLRKFRANLVRGCELRQMVVDSDLTIQRTSPLPRRAISDMTDPHSPEHATLLARAPKTGSRSKMDRGTKHCQQASFFPPSSSSLAVALSSLRPFVLHHPGCRHASSTSLIGLSPLTQVSATAAAGAASNWYIDI
ncbi:hypothetical protein C8J57DRAFT_1557450, partial [Mycena rebaudengoi]